MTLSSVCDNIPGALDILASHGIDDVDTLRDVLLDPAASTELARDLKAGPLAKLRKAIGITVAAPTSAMTVEVIDPDTMPVAALLERVLALPDDKHALAVAMRRVPRLVVDGPGIQGIRIPLTAKLLTDMAGVPVAQWPVLFRDLQVVGWQKVVPSNRPLYCPLTGEPVVEGFTTKSGLDWRNIPEDSYGLIASFAMQRTSLRHQTDKEILEAVRSGSWETSREYAAVRAAWTSLSPAQKLSLAESVYQEPVASGYGGTTVSGGVKRLDKELLDGFSQDELSRLVRYNLGAGILAELPDRSSPAEFAALLVDLCRRQGLIPMLISAASQERPNRASLFRAARV